MSSGEKHKNVHECREMPICLRDLNRAFESIFNKGSKYFFNEISIENAQLVHGKKDYAGRCCGLTTFCLQHHAT